LPTTSSTPTSNKKSSVISQNVPQQVNTSMTRKEYDSYLDLLSNKLEEINTQTLKTMRKSNDSIIKEPISKSGDQ
jgi:hypothetical protein